MSQYGALLNSYNLVVMPIWRSHLNSYERESIMSSSQPTQLPGDKLKKAISCFCELLETKPDTPRKTLLQEVEIKFDLSPLECEFLNKHFSESEGSDA